MLAVKTLVRHYEALCALVPLRPIRTEADYDAAVAALDGLLDAGAGGEQHPLAGLTATLGELIGDYEATREVAVSGSSVDILRFLMGQHALMQSDLPEIGSQGVVSEVLSGKRRLNARHARALAERFGIPAGVFLGVR
ncbi:MAG: Antitoxin HigA [Pseudomonadales bacterium]|nr:Antitoxin HigA [Pseudomonadales bacterium]